MRVLVASTAGAGHVGPLLPVVDALVRRGDEVLLVVPPALEATARATGRPYRLGADPPEGELAPLWRRFGQAPPDEAAVIANREVFGRLGTAAMLPAVRAAAAEWRPRLVVREPCEYASAVVAEAAGLPHVQVAISRARAEASSLDLAAPVLRPYVGDLPERLLAAPYLTRFPASLDPSPFPATHRFRETTPPPAPLPDWWDGDMSPLVYLTVGTVAGGLPATAAVVAAALDALAGLPVRVLFTTGGTSGAGLGPLPPGMHVEAWVPQADVLAAASVVVCHGGSGTTFGALAAGVPLVVVPMFADQPGNGRLVAAAGAGVVADATRDGIRAGVLAVLDGAGYRRAAARVAVEMGGLPDLDQALDSVTQGA